MHHPVIDNQLVNKVATVAVPVNLADSLATDYDMQVNHSHLVGPHVAMVSIISDSSIPSNLTKRKLTLRLKSSQLPKIAYIQE